MAVTLWIAKTDYPELDYKPGQVPLTLLSWAFLPQLIQKQGSYWKDGSHPTLAGKQSSVPLGHLNFALTVMHFGKGTDCKQEELWFCVSPRDERSKVFCFPARSQRIIATESGTACEWEQRTGARSTLFIANYLSGLKQSILVFWVLLSCSAMTATTTLHMLLFL